MLEQACILLLWRRIMDDAARRRLTEPRAGRLRRERTFAFAGQDTDLAITASLELARLLVSNQLVATAAHELEISLEVLTDGRGIAVWDGPSELWRLLLTLAVLYKGLGDAARARWAGAAAWRCASLQRCELGRVRARTFLSSLPRIET